DRTSQRVTVLSRLVDTTVFPSGLKRTQFGLPAMLALAFRAVPERRSMSFTPCLIPTAAVRPSGLTARAGALPVSILQVRFLLPLRVSPLASSPFSDAVRTKRPSGVRANLGDEYQKPTYAPANACGSSL